MLERVGVSQQADSALVRVRVDVVLCASSHAQEGVPAVAAQNSLAHHQRLRKHRVDVAVHPFQRVHVASLARVAVRRVRSLVLNSSDVRAPSDANQ